MKRGMCPKPDDSIQIKHAIRDLTPDNGNFCDFSQPVGREDEWFFYEKALQSITQKSIYLI